MFVAVRRCCGSRCVGAGKRCTYTKRRAHQVSPWSQLRGKPADPSGVHGADASMDSTSGAPLAQGMLPFKRCAPSFDRSHTKNRSVVIEGWTFDAVVQSFQAARVAHVAGSPSIRWNVESIRRKTRLQASVLVKYVCTTTPDRLKGKILSRAGRFLAVP